MGDSGLTNNPGYMQSGESIKAKWSSGTVKKENNSVKSEALHKNLAGDGKDNIVVQDKQGNLYTLSSNEITFKNGKLPEVQTNVSFVQLDEGLDVIEENGKKKVETTKNTVIEGKVIYADNEDGVAADKKIVLTEDFIRAGKQGVYDKPQQNSHAATRVYQKSSDEKAVAKLNKADCKIESDDKTLEEITGSMKNNGKDEVVVQDKDGNLYSFSSKNIDYPKGKMPDQHSEVNFVVDNGKGFVEIGMGTVNTVKVFDKVVGKVVYSDNDVTDGFSLHHPESKQNPLVREVRSNVKDNDLNSSLRASNIPSLVFKTGDGKRFIFYTDKLPEKLPEPFKAVKIAGVYGYVSFINNPQNLSKDKPVTNFGKLEQVSINNEKTKTMNKKMSF